MLVLSRNNAFCNVSLKRGFDNFYIILDRNSFFLDKVGNPTKVGQMASLKIKVTHQTGPPRRGFWGSRQRTV